MAKKGKAAKNDKDTAKVLAYLMAFLKEDSAFLFRVAECAYLIAKGWKPMWQLPDGHPKNRGFGTQQYHTQHAINSQRYYEMRGLL